MAVTNQTSQGNPMAANRIVLASLTAAMVALSINLLIYYLVPAIYDFDLDVPVMGPGSEIEPLPVFMVVMATLGAAMMAGLLLAILQRVTSHSVTVFRVIAAGVLLLSLAPLPFLPVASNVQVTLAALHTITAFIIVLILTRQGGGKAVKRIKG